MSKKISVPSLLLVTCTLFSTSIHAKTEWRTEIPPICGIKMLGQSGGIVFGKDNTNSSNGSRFDLKSNVAVKQLAGANQRGGYLRINLKSKSDNLADISNDEIVLQVKGQRRSHTDTLTAWQRPPGFLLPAGTYESWIIINQEMNTISMGEAEVSATLTLDCY